MAALEHCELVTIGSDGARMAGSLALPESAKGLVLFAHGSGSGRHSPRNTYVAGELRKAGLATLLIDLLTDDEDHDTATRFDIGLLHQRLAAAADFAAEYGATRALSLGLFGASTGAAAALALAAARPQAVAAVVARGGRPDLAGPGVLAAVQAPTLLLVGALDTDVVAMNQAAYVQLPGVKKLEIIPGASHLFEEPGRIAMVATHAADWFERYLSGPR
jgi:putative phosphoribosyl transferase